MPKFQRLLLDANVIIYTHELGVWKQLTEKCATNITRSVLEEAIYWSDNGGICHPIDLNPYIRAEKVGCIDVPLSQVDSFTLKFGPYYLDRLDPGEADSLAFLYYSTDDEYHICSSDGIVFRVLGSLAMPDRGISLEEVLQQIGLSRPFDEDHQQYTKAYRISLTKKGKVEGFTGMALKPEAESDKDK